MSTIRITDITSNRVDYVADDKSFFMHINKSMLIEAAGKAERLFEDVRLTDIKAVLSKFHPVYGKRV